MLKFESQLRWELFEVKNYIKNKVAPEVHQFFIDAFIGQINFAVELTKITAAILLDAVVDVKEYLTVSSAVQTAIENNFGLLIGFATVEEIDFCVGNVASFDPATFECFCESGFVLRDLATQTQSCDVEISFVEVVFIEFLGTLSRLNQEL